MERVAVYAGSFDPPTLGHLWMIHQGEALFDRVIVAIGINPAKKYQFSVEERLEMLRGMVRSKVSLEVVGNQYLFKWAKEHGAGFLLRGVRSLADFEYEKMVCEVNRLREPSLTSVFLMPPPELACVSSSFVKGLVGYDGWERVVADYVTPSVLAHLQGKR